MAINIFKSLVSYLFSNDEEKMKDAKPLKYITAGNGVFEVRENQVMAVSKKLDGIPKLPELREGISLHVPKIPFSVFNTMVSFMRHIYVTDSTESTVMVFYNKESGQFIPWVPLQENGSAASDYKRDEDAEYTKMCTENILVMVAHSHPWGSGGISTTSPSPSSIDDKDEKEAILYMVVSNVKGVPTTCVSTCPSGLRMKLNFFDVFENPLLPKEASAEASSLVARYVPNHEIFPVCCDTDMEFPKEWLARCKKKAYTYTRDYAGTRYYPSKGPGTQEDPARQYYDRSYGYSSDFGDDDYEGYSDMAFYSSYYGGYSYHGSKITAEHNEDDDGYAEVEVLEDAPYDDEAAYELIDVVDACHGFTDVEIATLIFELMKDGRGSLINQCMKARDEQKKTSAPAVIPVGSKSGDVPGLKLVKHEEHKKDGGK